MKIGDYVLATKYRDGDPKDQFCVGFLAENLGDRFMVVDSDGIPFRRGGFRRAQKISRESGGWIVANVKLIERAYCSVWYWYYTPWKTLKNISSKGATGCARGKNNPSDDGGEMNERGRKYDEGKLRLDLLPIGSVKEIVRVLTHGVEKYAPGNWKKVRPFRDRYYAALMRHLAAWRAGERWDPDSGLPHLAHAACCVIFLLWGERKAL